MGDVLRFVEPGILEQIIAKDVGEMPMIAEQLLVSAVFTVIPIHGCPVPSAQVQSESLSKRHRRSLDHCQ